jgi:hypothetical protein
MLTILKYWWYSRRLGNNAVLVRRAAAEALGKLGDSRAVEPLIRALGDSDHNVRRIAAMALGKLGDPRAVEPLIGRLGDSNHNVRYAIALALGALGDPRIVEPLIGVLGDSDHNVRRIAAEALGKLGGPRIVKPLNQALGDKLECVRNPAAAALGKLGVTTNGEDRINSPVSDEPAPQSGVPPIDLSEIPRCPRCGRPVMSRESKLCSFCGDKMEITTAGEDRIKTAAKNANDIAGHPRAVPSVDKSDSIVSELRELHRAVSNLPAKHPFRGYLIGPGVAQARQQFDVLCDVIGDVVRALDKGVDIHGCSISPTDTADGLKRFVADVRQPGCMGLVSRVLDVSGSELLRHYIDQLEDIAERVRDKSN